MKVLPNRSGLYVYTKGNNRFLLNTKKDRSFCNTFLILIPFLIVNVIRRVTTLGRAPSSALPSPLSVFQVFFSSFF